MNLPKLIFQSLAPNDYFGLKVFKNVNAQNKNYIRLRVWGKANFLSNFKVIT